MFEVKKKQQCILTNKILTLIVKIMSFLFWFMTRVPVLKRQNLIPNLIALSSDAKFQIAFYGELELTHKWAAGLVIHLFKCALQWIKRQ